MGVLVNGGTTAGVNKGATVDLDATIYINLLNQTQEARELAAVDSIVLEDLGMTLLDLSLEPSLDGSVIPAGESLSTEIRFRARLVRTPPI